MSSGLSDKKNAAVTESLGGRPNLGSQRSVPDQARAAVGRPPVAAILAFQLYVWIRWVSGPFFVPVPKGPSDPPTLMKVILIGLDDGDPGRLPVASITSSSGPGGGSGGSPGRHAPGGCGLMFFQDPLLNYFNTWCTYNTWMWNRGSWVPNIPGWQSYGEPGHMMSEPLLMNAPGYSFGVLLCTILGCWVMRKRQGALAEHQQRRLDRRLIAWTFFFDLIMEGLLLDADGALHLPRGYPGRCRSMPATTTNGRSMKAYCGAALRPVCARCATSPTTAAVHSWNAAWTASRAGSSSNSPSAFWRSSPPAACSSSCSTTFPRSGSPCTATRGLPTSRSARTSWAASAVDGSDRLCPDPALTNRQQQVRLHRSRRPARSSRGHKASAGRALPTRKVICRSRKSR